MKRLLFVLLAAAVVAPAALAKGPSAASVTGPGIAKTISLKGTEGSGPLGDLTTSTGFFPAAFGQSPDPMLKRRPTGNLGPRFATHYRVPAGNGVMFRITQQLYPYAKAGSVTYMKPGQRIFDTTTKGGWYLGGFELKRTLVRAGLARTAPRTHTASHTIADGGGNLAVVLGIGAPGAALLAGAAVFVARRRTAR